MNTVCLHLYGIPTPRVLSIKDKLTARLKDLDNLTVHLHEISDYEVMLEAKIESIPCIKIVQTQSFLCPEEEETLDGFVSRISEELSKSLDKKDTILINCGLCDGDCVAI